VPRLEARGIELAWEVLGDAGSPTAVLVHETATSREAWRPVARCIADLGGRAVIYDRRGWGESSAPADYRRTTVEEQSEDLAELIGAVGPVGGAYGAGLGGLIVLDLLLRHPDAVEAAVLVEPLIPGLAEGATEALSEDREALREAVQERGVNGLLDTYLEGRLGALGPGLERLPTELTQPARATPGSLAAELGAASGWSQPLRRLGEAEQTVDIVTCEDTPGLLREAAEALAERLAEGRRSDLPQPGPPHVRAAATVAGVLSSSMTR
jgi:pimeloyl-ACP methyl ester carboxylesterase